MNRRLRRLAGVGLVALMAPALSGCFLQTISGFASEFDGGLITTVRSDSMLTTCVQGGGGFLNFTCTYFFFDENGIPVDVTSSAELISEFGILGVVIDPLVVELPGNATNIAGTFDDGAGTAGDLVVYPNLSFVPVADNETLTPGPGKQLAILELPAGVSFDNVRYDFDVSFDRPGPPGPVDIKVVFTGKVVTNFSGKAFYPPLLPCTSDVASLPTITVPESAVLQPLALPTSVAVCMNRRYEYINFPQLCDLDNDNDVDRGDIGLILALRNAGADIGDPRDIDGDGVITALDARRCVVQCTRPRCA